MQITILIADSYPLLADGVEQVISSLQDFTIKGICLTKEELFNVLKTDEKPAIILLDPLLGKMDGRELCKKILALSPDTKIILLGAETDPLVVKKYFKAGIHGYLLRQATVEDLIHALKTVATDNFFIAPSIKDTFSDFTMGLFRKKKYNTPLTKREIEILHLIVEEYTMREIAKMLYVELCTIETHRHRIFQKLGVKNTAGLVRVAIQNRLYQISLP